MWIVSRFRRTLAMWLLLIPAGGTAATEPATQDRYPGDVRMRATFADGEAVLDHGPGERRISRIWRGHLVARRPWEDYRGRIAIGDCVTPGRTDGTYAFTPRTDAGLRGIGALNTHSGTFASWIRRSDLFDRGGMLFSGRTYTAGDARGGVHWALGIGGEGSVAPPGHLYLYTGQLQAMSNTPLPDGEWVHVAAAWDDDMGVRLYANGDLIGQTWREPGTGPAKPRTVFRGLRGPAAVEPWRISSDAQAVSHPIAIAGPDNTGFAFGGHPWGDGVRLAWDLWGEGFLRVIPRNMPEGKEELRLHSPTLDPLPPGHYLATLRYRQLFFEDPDDDDPVDRRGVGLHVHVLPESGAAGEAAARAPLSVSADGEDEWGEWHLLRQAFTVRGIEAPRVRFDISLPRGAEFMVGELRLTGGDPDALRDWKDYDFLTGFQADYWCDAMLDVDPVPVDRIQLHRHPQGGPVADIHVFDAPLAPAGIARLARGEIFEPGMDLPWEPVQPDLERRMQRLGWGENLDGDLIALAPQQGVTVRERWAERAYEDLRSAGSIAVDGIGITFSPWPYHGYRQVSPRKLHLKFPAPSDADYLVVRGDYSGRLLAGGTRAEPLGGESFLELPGSPPVFRRRLDRPLGAESATLLHGDGRLSGIHFYRVSPGLDEPTPARTYHLYGQANRDGLPLDEGKRQEFVTTYGPEDRRYVVGRAEAGTQAEARTWSALRSHHLFSPRLESDLPIAGVGLRLHLRGIDAPTRMQVRVHGFFTPWRERARLDFLLEPPAGGGTAVYETALRLRETLALEGGAAWVSLRFDRDVELLYAPGAGESRLALYAADPETAARNFLEQTLAGWRNAFESTSEPRVWNRGISDEEDDGWWLRAASPEYEHMVRAGRALLNRFPDDPRVQAWFAFIHPNMPNPAADIELPAPDSHPRWAVLARENLARYAEFIDWWTSNRAHENGELGNWIGDDTCLLQDWPDLAMIDDPDGVYRGVVRSLADGIAGRYLHRGRPFIIDGLNSRWTDGLHAYEDGLNMQPMAFLLEYGNPVLFHRLLATASRYDGFLLTEEENGMRRFNTDGTGVSHWNSDRPPAGSPYDRNWHLATHAGQVLMWYNGSPKISEMFSQVASWIFASRAAGRPAGFDRGGSYLLLALWQRTGDERYLAELIDLERARTQGVLAAPEDPTLVKRLPEGLYDPALTLEASRANADTRFDPIGTRFLGFGDRRYERNWFEWFLSRDKTYLEEGLAALYRRLTFSMPAVTVAEQSGDRVSIPKQIVSHMYLGGIPSARNNQFYPMYAASYEGLGRNFAALVLDDTEDLLRVLFYSFENEPLRGRLTAWGVGPGRFDIAGGPDRAGDDRIDAIEHRSSLELVRGDAFAIEIPPQQLYIWEARRVETGRPLWERPDLALAAEEAEREADGALLVRVHNIGSVPAPETVIELQTAEGAVVARRPVPALEAPLDLRPRTAELRFTAEEIARAAGPDGALVVVVDPDKTIEEITRRNNRIRIVAGF